MASQVFFTSNPAEYEKLEGLYVTERKPEAQVRGANANTVGMAGRCVRGPLTPQRITSAGRFLEVYGGRDYSAGGALVGEVWKALLNKPFGTIVVRRVSAAAAVTAFDNAPTSGAVDVLKISASSPGAWGNGITYEIDDATNGTATSFNLTVSWYGKTVTYENLTVNSAADTTAGLQAITGDDIANLVVLEKIADGRPENTASPVALTTGSDGTVGTSDYITGITDLANTPNVQVCLIPELAVTQATVNTAIYTLASVATDRMFLTWSGSYSNAAAAEISALGTPTRSDRVVWCYNAPKTLDPTTGILIDQAPHVWMASILSQIDVDVHPGSEEASRFLAGVSDLAKPALSRGDLVDLKAAGISTLEPTPEGYAFRSAVTMSLDPALAEITRRRSADFIQNSLADTLRHHVKAKNTASRRRMMNAQIVNFLGELRRNERIVEDFAVDQESPNSAEQRGRGLEKILLNVRLIGHILSLVLETNIGTGVTIQKQ